MTRRPSSRAPSPGGEEAAADVELRLTRVERELAEMNTNMAEIMTLLKSRAPGQGERAPASLETLQVETPTPELDEDVDAEDTTSVDFAHLGALPLKSWDHLGVCPEHVVQALNKVSLGHDAQQLAIAFKAAPLGGFPWEIAQDSGVLDKGQLGYKRYLPTDSVVRLLVPWWVSHQSQTMDLKGAQQYLPVLVEKLPNSDTMAKSPRGPGTWCTTLESFTKVFIEALAIIGPGARGGLASGVKHVQPHGGTNPVCRNCIDPAGHGARHGTSPVLRRCLLPLCADTGGPAHG